MNESMKVVIPVPDQAVGYRIGMLILTSIQQVLSGPRHGRWYPLPGNPAYDRLSAPEVRATNYSVKLTGASSRQEIVGAAYRASAPGEPPATRTGRLRHSFFMTVDPESDDTFLVSIRTNVYYADDLEYGTERVEARPFVKPAIERVMPEIKGLLENYVHGLVEILH